MNTVITVIYKLQLSTESNWLIVSEMLALVNLATH